MIRALRPWAVALLLLAAGWIASDLFHRRAAPQSYRRARRAGFRLVSPLLDVEMPAGWSVSAEAIPFEHKVQARVSEMLDAGRVRSMAVYYRDLLDGPWFGVNEEATFNPASMMKVPVMVAWLKRAERDPGVLLRTMVFEPREYPAPAEEHPPERSLEPGVRYTVEQLLQFLIGFSDNRAMWLLYRDLQPAEVDDVLDSMDVTNLPSGRENNVSAHGYSGFFRILFNAAYLDRDMSERALGLLAQHRFPPGFAAGLPPGTLLASKFGEWRLARDRVQLHEFGIVYHPAGPYILGVMTEGSDWHTLAGVLAEISALVYEEHQPRPAGAAGR